ncbi:DUF3341 domain-containing protein [Acidobacteriota bacterium]
MSDTKQTVGVVGLFDKPDDLIKAAAVVRDSGYRKWDCFTPYPIHGLEKAMGLKSSPVAMIGLAMGFCGAFLAMLMQWWMSAVDYPVVIGGKPLFSWPAFVPIAFELFVLFAALTTMACIILFCRLGRWHSPLHDSGIMAQITCDRYAVVLSAKDERFEKSRARELLQKAGCGEIRNLHENSETDEGLI